ncbi:MAG: hypothetical protein NC123_08185 [Butyrivibrio sp.]|nr:hypothetical protein [Acetatifactor muris]MCM1559508.1 hypothetical protein [Butyrivibrio sp.]
MKENISNAYFTVEAALVLPFVTSALIFAVFLFVFQYDRCLLEQDINMLALCAGTAAAENSEELETIIRRKASELSMDKYAAWTMNELQIGVKGDRVSVRGGGYLALPLPEWNFFREENQWETRVLRETLRISPADYVRLYRKIKDG